MNGLPKSIVWKQAKWDVVGRAPGQIWNRKRFAELPKYKRDMTIVRDFAHRAAVDREWRDHIMAATEAWAQWAPFSLSPERLQDYLDASVMILEWEIKTRNSDGPSVP